MANMIEIASSGINKAMKDAIQKSIDRGELNLSSIPDIMLEAPREKEHGDFAANTAMVLAREAKKSPRQIAEIIVKNLDVNDTYIGSVDIAGPGFINFKLKNDWLYDTLKSILREKENYGRVNIGHGKRMQVEFVSANPTGPMHIGNARGGAIGDILGEVLKWAGFYVEKEFYVNDAGNQINKFGKSLEARYLEALGLDAQFPEGGYMGLDIVEHAENFKNIHGDKYVNASSMERQKALIEYALNKNLDRMKKDLEDFGINFDVWFSEQSLYDNGDVEDTVKYFKKSGNTYENEDALWFKATNYGVEKDEVLVRANGIPTYFTGDVAYHRNKFVVRKFDKVIDIWGADHHGHVPRMKGAMGALGLSPDALEIIIMQLVRLIRNGEVTRMSKRKGQSYTLSDLVEEVGKDAARFFFNLRSADTHFEFDLDLAVEKSNENPVYYVQYAHARICSILRQLNDEGINFPEVNSVDFNALGEQAEIDLIKKMSYFPEEVTISAQSLDPSRITKYVLELASLFHTFYNSCRVKGVSEDLMKARMVIIECTRTVIKNCLLILGISAPERM
ncbi:arginine--tRNA ligase [Oxobacter pfennigii]|uniref:Arginine--tRNA ligase n=1 Tax=Oxobacter pfennigii TaxID=36849 RepID=A0A0P8W7F5_9CLOT|nr:arginine--tRNA ligase [Oxobacter pfennigii]KPU44591.1 arginine--tRNA ligase [Oxobacter pfennigii]